MSLCADEESPPFAFVVIEGTATASEDAPDLRSWTTRIAARYMGGDRAEDYGARNGVPGELLIRVRPNKVVGQRGVAE